MTLIAVGGALIALAAVLTTVAFRDSIAFFVTPSELMAAPRDPDRALRIGGMVMEGSVKRGQGETVRFVVTDYDDEVPIAFTGVLPDLFREGQGVVAEGRMIEGVFVADEVLAKHDEKYMPAEIADDIEIKGDAYEPPGE